MDGEGERRTVRRGTNAAGGALTGKAPDVTIRDAGPADIEALGRFGALLVRTHHAFDPARFIAETPQTADGYGAFLGTQLTKPNVSILVAEQDGEVVGYTYAGAEGFDYMSLRGPAGGLYDIVVDPAHRERGIGRMLIDATFLERGAGCAADRTFHRGAE